MGSSVSKMTELEDAVVTCRERKRQLKLAVERRYAFADAQCKYNNSLYAVAIAIKLFVESHTLPSALVFDNPMLLQQRPSKSTRKINACRFSDSEGSVSSSEVETEKKLQENLDDREEEEDSDDDSETDEKEAGCEQFSDEDSPTMPSPNIDSEWDQFLNDHYDDDQGSRKARDKKGERVKSKKKAGGLRNCDVRGDCGASGSQREAKAVRAVTDTPKIKGRELLAALKEVEEYFHSACESGLDVSRILETNMVQMQYAWEEINENSSKLSMTLRGSKSSTLSRRSLRSSSSRSSSRRRHFSSGHFDDDEAKGSKCHTKTLGKLYALEEEHCEKMKVVLETSRRMYSELSKQNARRRGLKTGDKIGVELNELISRNWVAKGSAESIHKRIQRLRDEEMQQQVVRLLHGLKRNWKIMSEAHENQKRILSQVESLNYPSHGMLCNESHRLATRKLEAELRNWCACFASYVSSQKAYVQGLSGWLSNFVTTETELNLKGRSSHPSHRVNKPQLLVICDGWLERLNKLPEKAVIGAMESFGNDLRGLKAQQRKEHKQEVKVDKFKVKGLTERTSSIRGLKLFEQDNELHVRNQTESVDEMQVKLKTLKKMRDAEVANTKEIAVKGFQTGLSSVFESLAKYFDENVRGPYHI